MRRGEIRLVDFEPVRGSEADKTRPAVIVSNNGANTTAVSRGRGVVVAAAECGLDHDSKVQAEQIRAVAAERIGRRLGALPHNRLIELDAALRVHLAL